MAVLKHYGRVFLLLAIAGAMLVLACGGGEATSTPSPTATPQPTAIQPPTATAVLATPLSPGPTVAPTAAPTATAVPTRPPATPTSAAPQPKRGGTFLVPVVSLVTGTRIDPHAGVTVLSQIATSGGYDTLVRMAPPGHTTVAPSVLESWQVSPDGLIYTFKVRDGIKFHNGATLTAADVVFTLKRIQSKAGVGSLAASTISDVVSSVDQTDDRTVRVTLKFPSGSFLERLAFPLNVVMPKDPTAALDAAGTTLSYQNLVGSGAFRSPKEQPSVSVEWVRNDNYWGKDDRGNRLPFLDKVLVLQIADREAALAALRTGQVHITRVGAGGMLPAHVPIVRKAQPDKIIIKPVDLWAQFRIMVNTTKAPWNDVRVRRALNLAIDRQTLIAFYGQEFASISGPMPQGPWALPQDELLKLPGFRQPKDQDIAEAKRLLKDANVPDGFQYTSTSSSASDDLNILLTDMVAKIGLKHQPTPLASGVRDSRVIAGDFEVDAQLEAFPLSDPDFIVRINAQSKGATNYGRFSSPDFDAFADKVTRELDFAKRQQLARDWDRQIIDLAYPISGIWIAAPQAYWYFIHNWDQGPGVYNGWSDYDIVWMDQ